MWVIKEKLNGFYYTGCPSDKLIEAWTNRKYERRVYGNREEANRDVLYLTNYPYDWNPVLVRLKKDDTGAEVIRLARLAVLLCKAGSGPDYMNLVAGDLLEAVDAYEAKRKGGA